MQVSVALNPQEILEEKNRWESYAKRVIESLFDEANNASQST